MYTLIIDEIAYELPTGLYTVGNRQIIITSINIQVLPNINRIISGKGLNVDPLLAQIEVRAIVRELKVGGKKIDKTYTGE